MTLEAATIFAKNKLENQIIESVFYLASEVLSRNYSEKFDLWNTGVIIYLLLTGLLPICDKDNEETFNLILNSNHN